MLKPGDVETGTPPGAVRTKARPVVVVSTGLYQSTKLDVIVSELTTQLARATDPTDYILQDWAAAGLHKPSAFRVYIGTVLVSSVTRIGHLSDRDWQEVQARLRLGLAVT
jgi:mRNA-degrading endonuclease toxin of MazEF toxin-antitoxin module